MKSTRRVHGEIIYLEYQTGILHILHICPKIPSNTDKTHNSALIPLPTVSSLHKPLKISHCFPQHPIVVHFRPLLYLNCHRNLSHFALKLSNHYSLERFLVPPIRGYFLHCLQGQRLFSHQVSFNILLLLCEFSLGLLFFLCFLLTRLFWL